MNKKERRKINFRIYFLLSIPLLVIGIWQFLIHYSKNQKIEDALLNVFGIFISTIFAGLSLRFAAGYAALIFGKYKEEESASFYTVYGAVVIIAIVLLLAMNWEYFVSILPITSSEYND
jgi:hypothetical protein